MRLKKSKTANKSATLDWDYQPPKINGGKETIDDMSLVVGMYGNYEVTKTGHLVGILGSSPKCWCKLNSANLSFHKLKHTGFF